MKKPSNPKPTQLSHQALSVQDTLQTMVESSAATSAASTPAWEGMVAHLMALVRDIGKSAPQLTPFFGNPDWPVRSCCCLLGRNAIKGWSTAGAGGPQVDGGCGGDQIQSAVARLFEGLLI
jgi:hypothetical protein